MKSIRSLGLATALAVASATGALTVASATGALAAAAQLTGDRIPANTGGDITVHPMKHATMALGWNGQVIYVDEAGLDDLRNPPPPTAARAWRQIRFRRRGVAGALMLRLRSGTA